MVKRIVNLEELRGRRLAVDGNSVLYQFLSLIRKPDGIPLMDSAGNVTSHLVGLMFRSTRLIHDYGIKTVFVFDGKPPQLKDKEIEKRRALREKAVREWKAATQVGDYATAWSKAVMTSRLTKPLIEDAKRLLELLGIPYLRAPSEGEAQTAHMAKRGDVWAANSRDYDSLLFGAPRLVRYVTISGREFLPSKGVSRPLEPEIISLRELLSHHGITREQLVDLAILIGTDFNEGIKGMGPKTALKLLREYGSLEGLPEEVKSKLPAQPYKDVRTIFLKPQVTDNYRVEWGELQEEELYDFLCEQRGFSKSRVKTVVERMKSFYARKTQASLEKWDEDANG
jgi:flap endonuclease-1